MLLVFPGPLEFWNNLGTEIGVWEHLPCPEVLLRKANWVPSFLRNLASTLHPSQILLLVTQLPSQLHTRCSHVGSSQPLEAGRVGSPPTFVLLLNFCSS